MKAALAVALCLCLMGCGLIPARIKAPGVSVQGVRDAGKPATLVTSDSGESVALPEGSRVTVTKVEAMPAKPATATEAAQPAQPAKTITEIQPSGPTIWQKTETKVNADTGTVDTSIAQHRIDVAERRWLLWAAIGCGIAGIVIRSMIPAYPSLSNGLLIAAALAGASWKLADIPSWIWLVALGVFGALAAGYKRAELDKDGDGVPDVLQKAKQPEGK